MRQFSTRSLTFLFALLALPGFGIWQAQAQTPMVNSLLPARNAVAAPRSGPVTVGFSQSITAASAPNLRVYGSQVRGKRPGTISGGGTAKLSFAPTQAFAAGERVSVTVPNTITNAAGTGASRQVYQFTAATGGAGRGFFLDTTEVASTNSRDQLLGDIDGDGDLDLLTSIGLFGMHSYLNNGQGKFTSLFNTFAAKTPSGAALADLNQDGSLDLLTGDADNATVAIALNNGSGEFGVSSFAGQLVTVGTRPVSIATGDVDGDGDIDFASANFTSNTVSIGTNNGTGYFTGLTNWTVGAQPTTVQLADIDNDGDLDLLTSNGGSNTVSLRLNNGGGNFGAVTSITVGIAPSDLALADIDGDGDLDLLTTNSTDGSVSVLRNSLGTFSGLTTLTLPPNSTPTGLSTGDVDADGDLDVVVAQGTGGQVITYLNNGSGNLSAQYGALELGSPGTNPYSVGVTLGDMDGDGDLDVVTAGANYHVVLGRDGLAPPVAAPMLASFSPAAGPVGTTVRLAGTSLSSTSAVKFNGVAASFVVNSNQQLTTTVPAGASTGAISVTTAGGVATSAQSFIVTAGPVPPVLVTGTVPVRNAVAASPTAAVQATFNSPISGLSVSAFRVFGSQRSGRQLGTVSGSGTTTLSQAPSPAFAPGERVSLSLPAALTGTSGGSVRPQVVEFRAATRGTGEGIYATAGPVSTLTTPSSGIHSADFDNDGDLDLVGVQTTTTTSSVFIRFNNGSGTFSAAPAGTLPTAATQSYEPIPADVDGDGDLDLLVPEVISSAAQLSVWLNNGQGRFTMGTPLRGTGAQQLLAGDIDADGDLDIIFAENYDNVRVASNNGTGIFMLSSVATGFVNIQKLQLADIDNDGDLDVLVMTDAQLISALNDGQGVLTKQAGQVLYFGYLRDMAVADLTSDGLPDVVIAAANVSSGQPGLMAVWPGLGNGQFGPRSLPEFVGSWPSALLLADVNADGKLDALALSGEPAGNTPATLHLRLGDGHGSLTQPSSYAVAAANQTVGSPLLADFDGDGDLDLLTQNTNLLTLNLSLNTGRPAPTLATVAPAQGPVGTRVLLTGTNLNSTRRVTFGGVAATDFTPLSATQCTAVVPPGAITGAVTLTTPAGTTTSSGSFTVTVPVLPSSSNPARNAVHVARNSNVSATFAQALPASATGSLVVQTNLRQGRRAGVASGAGTATLTFNPNLDFAPGEKVQVSLTGGSGTGAVLPQVYDFVAATGGPGQGNMRWGGFTDYSGGTVGDFDEDGAPDMITQEPLNGQLRILFNNGLGQLGARTQTTPNPLVRAIRMVDVNGDAHLDLVMSEFVQYRLDREINRLVWRAGTGTGTFGTAQPIHTANGAIQDIAVGDLNGDGLPDLTALMQGADSVLISLNMGNGVFQRRADAAAVRGANTLRLADIDNNGTLDLLTTGTGGALTSAMQISRSLGTGAGDFVPTTPLMYAEQVLTFELGDVDGDGKVDLVAGTASTIYQGSVKLRRGDGQGNFGPTQTVGPNGYFGYLQLADFNADGNLDLIAAQTVFFSGAQLLFNDGTGQFARATALATNTVPRAVTVADFDLDGSLDVAFGGDSLIASNGSSYKTGLYMYYNRPAAPSITSFTPTSGPAGTVVTLTGLALASVTSVKVGGVPVTFTAVSATQITLTTAANTATGVIVVTSPFGTATSTGTFTVPVPTIASFTPGSGAVQRLITLTGSYFGGTTAVQFNNLTAPGFTVVSGTQLTVPVPAGATTGLLRVTTPSGTATSATSFTVVPNPQVVTLSPARNARAAPVAGRISLTYSQAMDANSATGVRVFGTQLRGRRGVTTGGGGTPTLSFAPTQPFAAGEAVSVSVPAGLLDANGNPVLAPQVYQFRAATSGTGRGTFAPASAVALTNSPLQMVTGDVDQDGDLDLLTLEGDYQTNTPRTANLRLNNGTGGFGTSRILTLGTGTKCTQLTLADVDNDSDLDVLAVFGDATSTVNILLNDGTGQFTPGTVVSTGSEARALAVGDLNGDGNLDLAVAEAYSPGLINIRLGNGRGNFTASPAASIRGATTGLTLGDVDNDGDLDLVSYYHDPNYNNNYSSASIRLNDGRGLFSGSQDFYESYGIGAVELADFDGDGDLDLATVQDRYWTMVVKANDGAGNFTTNLSSTVLRGQFSGGMVIGDVDADGDLDVLFNHNNQLVASLCVNQGNGTFGQSTAISLMAPQGMLALADIDTDGDLDLLLNVDQNIVVRRNGPTPAVLPLATRTPGRNSRAVSRTATVSLGFGQAISATTASNWLVFGDQRQGRRAGTYAGGGSTTLSFSPTQPFAPGEKVSVSVPATLASTTAGLVKAEVFQFTAATAGTGIGAFTLPTAALATMSMPEAMLTATAADVNGDGAPDLLSLGQVGNSSVLHVQLNTNTRQAAFGAASSLSVGNAQTLAVGDVDGDGDLDVVTAEYSVTSSGTGAQVEVLVNNGRGGFTSRSTFVGPYGISSLQLADFDADGDLDVACNAYGQFTINFNNGQGSYAGAPYQVYHQELNVHGFAVGDFDQNGGLDIAFADASSGFLYFWHNDNGPALTGNSYIVNVGSNRSPLDVQLTDMDGDGDLDLLLLCRDRNSTAGSVVIYRNDGLHQFNQMQIVTVGNDPSRLTVGDLDHDGDPDLAVTSSSGSTVSLRFNPGTLGQSFTAPTTPLTVGSQPLCLTLADLDGDLDLDLLTVSGSLTAPSISLRLNGGTVLGTRSAVAEVSTLRIYPNPASARSLVQIEASIGIQGASLKIINMLGQVMLTQQIAAASNGTAALSLPNLAPGAYVIRLTTSDGQVFSQPLVVK